MHKSKNKVTLVRLEKICGYPKAGLSLIQRTMKVVQRPNWLLRGQQLNLVVDNQTITANWHCLTSHSDRVQKLAGHL